MTEEQKELLAKDLSSRIQYGVVLEMTNPEGNFEGNFRLEYVDKYWEVSLEDHTSDLYPIDWFKPYLRSTSKMTAEEALEFVGICMKHAGKPEAEKVTEELLEFYCSNHFDFHGLIPMGLAKEITEEYNPYKK